MKRLELRAIGRVEEPTVGEHAIDIENQQLHPSQLRKQRIGDGETKRFDHSFCW